MLLRILALALACAAAPSFGQLLGDIDPDWKEVEAPPPPAVRTQGLIPIEMPPGMALRFGVDPDSITVGADGVVRYVVVASSPSGALNAMYEGLRCNTAQVRVYARYNADSGWVPMRGSEWQPLQNRPNSRHSLTIARTGACVGQGPSGNASEIVRALRTPPDLRFMQR
jgi:hypothetical protein